MKTFRDFIAEGVAERLGKMSDADFEQFLKGRTPGEEKEFRAKRAAYTTSGTAGQGVQDAARQARQQKTQPPSGGGKPPAGATPSGGTTSAAPNTSKIPKPVRRVGRGLVRGFGVVSAADAVYQASQGNYADAAASGLGAGMASRRVSAAVPRIQKQVLQKVAPKVAPKLARFVPGLQQAYGLTAGTTALAKGDKLGAVLGYGSAIPGPVGYGFVAADIARSVAPSSVKQAIKDKTGISYLQQRKGLEQKAIQSGQGLTGVARAGQTMDVRGARQVASQAKTYGATKGSALTGLGGPTKVDTKAGTLTTKDKTVKLASTQLVRDPKTGQQRVGDLAYKGGKAVYLARPSVASRDTSLSAKVGRALNLGKYSKEAEQKAAQTEYRTALKNTQAYTKSLGISTKSATAQKLPGYGTAPAAKPKPVITPVVKPAVAGGGMGGRRGGGSSPGSIKTAPAAKPKPVVKPAVAGGGMGGRRGGGSSPGSIKK